jgi:hypothetical protein
MIALGRPGSSLAHIVCYTGKLHGSSKKSQKYAKAPSQFQFYCRASQKGKWGISHKYQHVAEFERDPCDLANDGTKRRNPQSRFIIPDLER